jgi:hypothetical protein
VTVKVLAKALPTVLELRPLLVKYLRIAGVASLVFLQLGWAVLVVYLFLSLFR